jgi:hypothetical protein
MKGCECPSCRALRDRQLREQRDQQFWLIVAQLDALDVDRAVGALVVERIAAYGHHT